MWEHPVTSLERDSVTEVAMLLGRVEQEVVLAALPADAAAALTSLGMSELKEHPRSYLQKYLAALSAFYADAAQRQLAVALWWD